MVGFGVQLWLEEYDLVDLRRAAREVEDLGYGSLWVYDHFYPMSRETSWSIMEPWTALTYLATQTEEVRLGVLVTCNSYRHPPILAKMAATVDVISGGRLEFGIGAGWFRDEYEAYGIPFRTASERIAMLGEGLEIIKGAWTRERFTFNGRYYRVRELVSEPKPVQKPHPPIWVGGKDRRVFRIAARYADYLNIALLSPGRVEERLRVFDEVCREAGRRPGDVERTWHGFVFLGDSETEVRKRIKRFKENSNVIELKTMGMEEFMDGVIAGTPEKCVEKINQYIEKGISYFVLNFPYSPDMKAQRIFAEKVIPLIG